MSWEHPLRVTHDDYIVDTTGGIIPLEEIVAALNAAHEVPSSAELVKKLNASDLLNAHADAIAFARTRPYPNDPASLSTGLELYGEHMRASIARLLSEGGAA